MNHSSVATLAKKGLLHEADTLATLASTPSFTTLIEHMEDYPDFLASRRYQLLGESFSTELMMDHMLDFDRSDAVVIQLKQATNLLAACDLFAGWSLPLNALEQATLREHTARAIRDLAQSRPDGSLGPLLAQKLNSCDTTRVIHLLKILGCIAPDMTGCFQLSLGASGGTRDRHSMHRMPAIEYTRHNPLLRQPPPESITFGQETHSVKDIVLVDNDPQMHKRYERLNREENTLALNQDMMASLKILRERIAAGDTKPRNLVVAFRIDHRMIPDAMDFIKHLREVTADAADLIITIGAGHSNKEFKGRCRKISELEQVLRKQRLSPLRIIWHRGTSIAEQRNSPLFGAPTYATYEILYCKIIRE